MSTDTDARRTSSGNLPVSEALFDASDLAPSTRRIYRTGWEEFSEWARSRSYSALPASPEVVAEYLLHRLNREDLSRHTLRNRLSAIGFVHESKDLEDPTSAELVRAVLQEISKKKRSASAREEGARLSEHAPSAVLKEGLSLLSEHFEQGGRDTSLIEHRHREAKRWTDPMVNRDRAVSPDRFTEEQRDLIPPLEYDLVTVRDRALLLLIAGGARRSEVVRMEVSDAVLDPEAPETLLAGLRKSNGQPKRVLEIPKREPVELCIARAVAAWILIASLIDGPLFRSFTASEDLKRTRISPSTVNLIIERRAEACGLDPDGWSPTRLRTEGGR